MTREKDESSEDKKVVGTPAQSKPFHEKSFEVRESLITGLLEINHIQAFRNMIFAVLILALLNVIVYDLTTFGSFAIHPKFDLWIWVMQGLDQTLLFNWLPMFLSTLLVVYSGFYFYAAFRNSMGSLKGLFDKLFVLLYAIFVIAFVVLPIWNIESYSLGNRVLILFEQVRMIMKFHAFVRSNVERVLEAERERDESTVPKPVQCPEISKYLYFLFAPTLIYRDNYPKSPRRRWDKVFLHLAEVFGCIVYCNALFEQLCIPVYGSFKIPELTLASFIRLNCMSIIPGGWILVTGFFVLLHTWQNLFAELLRFGDRQFYTDWWNSRTFNEYYRKWNILVQDWLYHYIFKDLYTLLGRKNKVVANLGVILISGIVHEYIISFGLCFFFPVMLFLFCGLGSILLFVRVKNPKSVIGNIIVWVGLFQGAGLYLGIFMLEWYSRHTPDCPRTIDSALDYFVPRSITCALNHHSGKV